ncbi:MAG: alcohol dehydrogenase catalytic domain-containing protein [Acidimicrobiia bacterium]|nr:alcohol dehydrogenase catalytic domain-containing protein [Acidimicrobiia bacterium]
MKALVYEGPGLLALREAADPEPGAGEVLLDVLAAGVCGTDHHIVAGELGVVPGTVPGHEICGRIAAVGPDVAGWEAGTRVVSYGQVTCEACPACLSGNQNRCVSPQGLGMARQGGFAERIAVPARCVAPLPDPVSDAVGAIATDAIATPFHALVSVGRIRPGESVVVIGTGGLGMHAVLLARMAGAGRIVAVDPSPGARDAALAAGADAAFDPAAEEDPARALRALARGTTLAVELVGRAATVELGLATLAPGGRLVVVGVGTEQPRLPPLIRFIGTEVSVHGAFGSTLAEIETVLGLIAAGRLDVSRSVGRIVPLDKGPAVLREPAAPARTVLDPTT